MSLVGLKARFPDVHRLNYFVYEAAVAILHFCLYWVKTITFVVPGLTISKFYGNTMLVILNNRMKILNGRMSTSDSVDNLDSVAADIHSRGGSEGRSVFTLPSDNKPGRSGGNIIVGKERLLFRLDNTPRHTSVLQSVSESEFERDSVKESDAGYSGQMFVSLKLFKPSTDNSP